MRSPSRSGATTAGARGPVERRGAAHRRHILPDLEGAFDGLGGGASAPARDKRAGQRRVAKIDRDGVVDDAAQPRRGDRPALGAAIVVEPALDIIEPDA